ncbi:ER-golgi trafficking TRAPP I complex 85 kDa subunit-domain-containing protein [Tuber brumale]|nr:ER-golgi trafficking TRAPP I complex 85 kDa subunit-domain-containing protein [Tuber brumale]
MSSAFPSLRTRPTLPAVGVSRATSVYLRSSSIAPVHSSVTSLNSLFNQASLNSPRSPEDEDCKGLVCRAFVPYVAVHVSDDTNELAREKGFVDFKDMLRPYGESIQGRITIRDSQGISTTHDDYGIRFVSLVDVAGSGEKWESGTSRAMNGSSEKAAGSGSRVFQGGSVEEVEDLVNLHMERAEELNETSLPSDGDTPAFNQSFYMLYLRRILSALPLSPHETFSHPVACVIAISSRNANPIDSLRNLYNSGNHLPLPDYLSTDYLRYYVLVHDEDRDDIKKSTLLFDQMKKHFGLHCHLLRLRSGGASVISDDDAVVVPKSQWVSAAEELHEIRSRDYDDEQPTACLPDSDATGIQTMVREMTQVSVIPFMERCIATWNDQVASRRRGISGRFISMSKRYFSTSSSRNSTSSSSNYDALNQSYPPSSPEAQMRKLADYAFMVRDWRLAHSIYELLRTDFNNDKAWKYHAGAQEMAAISLILTGTGLTSKVRADTIAPMLDLSCYSYLSRCSATYHALRCLLVAVELLRIRGGGAADEAATWAIRARDMNTQGTIGHALITERVGACYTIREGIGSGAWGARKRKAAMWKMLAAGEWLEVAKLAQSRRCLDTALPVYEGSRFPHVHGFMEHLKQQAGYTPLLVDLQDGRRRGRGEGEEDDSDEEEGVEIQSETLHTGLKRKSLIVGREVEREVENEAESGLDRFVDS